MKNSLFCILLFIISGCNNKSTSTEINNTKEESSINENINDSLPFSEENLELNHEKTKSIKREKLIIAEDDKLYLQKMVVTRKFYKEHDHYILDYKYPYLNEKVNPKFSAFNLYIKETYLDIEKTEDQIVEDHELLCDSLKIKRFQDKRILDYKIFTAKNNLISVLLYKENYYSGMKHSTYSFDCLNFDTKEHKFMYYDDFFRKGSEQELFKVINNTITQAISKGELYYDCWELSEGDFNAYKNNFVVNDDAIEFYFDDCIICPSYTGTYSVSIPITKIMHLIKSYNNTPVLGQ